MKVFALALAGLGTGFLLVNGLPAQAANSRAASVTSSEIKTPDYVKRAAMSDMFEVQSSKLALEKSKNPAVRSFAQHMVDDHTASSEKLKETLQSANVDATVPSSLDQKHQKMLQQLQGDSGAKFDRAYLQMQVKGHQDALKLQRAYSQTGENDALKQIAQQTAPMVQEHLNEAQKLAQSKAQS